MLKGTNIPHGYKKGKIDFEEKEDSYIILIKKNNENSIIKIKLSKEHFQEFVDYSEKRQLDNWK